MFKKILSFIAIGILASAVTASAAGRTDFQQVGAQIITPQTITGADTLTVLDAGQTIFVGGGSGGTITLPTAKAGLFFRFQVSAAYDTANIVIDSAEGDNIEGTLIVAGAVVDCDAEDQINFVADGENLGDYVEVISDGTNWLIVDSGVLTAAKMTCTDPS
jgi:hypothetical protein